MNQPVPVPKMTSEKVTSSSEDAAIAKSFLEKLSDVNEDAFCEIMSRLQTRDSFRAVFISTALIKLCDFKDVDKVQKYVSLIFKIFLFETNFTGKVFLRCFISWINVSYFKATCRCVRGRIQCPSEVLSAFSFLGKNICQRRSNLEKLFNLNWMWASSVRYCWTRLNPQQKRFLFKKTTFVKFCILKLSFSVCRTSSLFSNEFYGS